MFVASLGICSSYTADTVQAEGEERSKATKVPDWTQIRAAVITRIESLTLKPSGQPDEDDTLTVHYVTVQEGGRERFLLNCYSESNHMHPKN